LIFLLPLFLAGTPAFAQTSTGSVHGVSADGGVVRLVPTGDTGGLATTAGVQGRFHFDAVAPGWYVLVAQNPTSEFVRAVKVEAGKDLDVGQISTVAPHGPSSTAQVMTVCEALGAAPPTDPVVIVGIFKSGMDPTLRQDCPNELVSGGIAWPNMIALSGSTEAPDRFVSQVEQKKAEIFAAYPPEAKPRTERLVGLYGILVMPGGLTSAPCCHAAAETVLAPARLIGIDEKDRRVIR
jgi:hypothetical protein